MDRALLIAMVMYILMFACVGIMEKRAVSKHHYMHFSTARMFYILLITLVILFIMQPSVLSSRELYVSMKDPMVGIIGIFTALAIILYYWMLSRKDLWWMTMLWPIVMLLTIIGACIFMKEQISWKQWIGIIVTYIGLFITFVSKT